MTLSESSWSWSYGSWIYNYLCNQCLSSLMLWVRISIRARRTTLCDIVCGWFSPGPPVSSTNKTDRHNITEILLKVALNTIKQTKQRRCLFSWYFIVKSCKWLIDKLWQNTILHSICQMRFVSTYTCTSQVQNVIYVYFQGFLKIIFTSTLLKKIIKNNLT